MDKDKIIEELKEQLQMEIMVKKSEVVLNRELCEKIEKHLLTIETLQEINEDFSNKIANLRFRLKKINELTNL